MRIMNFSRLTQPAGSEGNRASRKGSLVESARSCLSKSCSLACLAVPSQVQTNFKQGSNKVQTRLQTRFKQGENPSKQGSTRLNKVEFFSGDSKLNHGTGKSPILSNFGPDSAQQLRPSRSLREARRLSRIWHFSRDTSDAPDWTPLWTRPKPHNPFSVLQSFCTRMLPPLVCRTMRLTL